MTAAKQLDQLIKRRWEPAEDEVLGRVWPRGTVPEILAALPGRSIRACSHQAYLLGIRCESRQHLAKVVSPVIVRGGVPGKACVRCLVWRPLEKFAKHSTCAGGRRNICMTCAGRIHGKAYYETHREQCIARSLGVQKANPERSRLYRRNSDAKRRSRGCLHHGKHNLTIGDLERVLDAFGSLCVYCGEPADTLDHVVPLSRGGEHAVHNLVPACGTCNRQKKAKLLSEWSGPRAKGV